MTIAGTTSRQGRWGRRAGQAARTGRSAPASRALRRRTGWPSGGAVRSWPARPRPDRRRGSRWRGRCLRRRTRPSRARRSRAGKARTPAGRCAQREWPEKAASQPDGGTDAQLVDQLGRPRAPGSNAKRHHAEHQHENHGRRVVEAGLGLQQTGDAAGQGQRRAARRRRRRRRSRRRWRRAAAPAASRCRAAGGRQRQ